MEFAAASHCRDVLDRMRAQVLAHLPPVVTTDRFGNPVSDQVVPLDRLPLLGQYTQQYIEAEAVYASANPTSPTERAAEDSTA